MDARPPWEGLGVIGEGVKAGHVDDIIDRIIKMLAAKSSFPQNSLDAFYGAGVTHCIPALRLKCFKLRKAFGLLITP